MSLQDILDEVGVIAHKAISMAKRIDSTELGIQDGRTGVVYIHKDFVAVYRHQRNNMDTYGGGEYARHVIELGPYVLYIREVDGEVCPQVDHWIDCYYSS